MKKSELIIGKIALLIGAFFLCASIFMMYSAISQLSDDYRDVSSADLSQEYSGTLSYDDHIYAQLVFGLMNDPADGQREAFRAGFIKDSLSAIDKRIISTSLFYVLIVTTLLQFWLYQKNRHNFMQHFLFTGITVLLLFTCYFVAAYALNAAFKVPYYFPPAQDFLTITASLLTVIAGSIVLAAIIRWIRYKTVTSVLAVFAAVMLFMFSSVTESGLISDRTVESFAYIQEIDSRILDENYDGPLYYDEERNVVVIGDTVYEPQYEPNPDYFTGVKRIGAVCFEAVNPYGGSGLYLISDAIEKMLSPLTSGLYVIKAAIWTVLASMFTIIKEKKKQ